MPIVRKWTARTEKDWMMDWGSRISSSLEACRLEEQISAVHQDPGRSANRPRFGYVPFRPLTRTPSSPKTSNNRFSSMFKMGVLSKNKFVGVRLNPEPKS